LPVAARPSIDPHLSLLRIAMQRALPIVSGLTLAILLAGCGKPRPAEPTENKAAPAAAPAAAVGGDESGAGLLDRSHAGSAAPTSSFQDPDGEDVSLTDFRDRPLLLNLWATWCGPCITEMPTLDALSAHEKGRIRVLAVSQDLNGASKVDAFFNKYNFANLAPYVDPETGLTEALHVDTLPTTILYDAAGREVWRIIGKEDWSGARAATLLAEATAPSPRVNRATAR
jgi:thiol-disulfide isomerase/thioredoxin